MEVCRSPKASNHLHGTASPYVDEDFEFNAPRFFDFQRLQHNVDSPSSEGDTYFDTSKVKELRTPIRNSGEEDNEDTAQLQKDIQRVRDALQAEGEATSKMRPDCAGAESPAASPVQTGGEKARHVPDEIEAAGLSVRVDAQEETAVSGTVKAVGPMRVRQAGAVRDMAEPSSNAPASEMPDQQTTQADAKAGSSLGVGSAAASDVAHKHGQEQEEKPMPEANAGNPRALGIVMQPQQDAAAAKAESRDVELPNAPAAHGAIVPVVASQKSKNPAPWPIHPAKLTTVPDTGTKMGGAEQTAPKILPVPKKAAPANLVTSWGPKGRAQAPAQHASLGLVASGTTSLVHSAGKSKIGVMASNAVAPSRTADGASKSAEKDVREQSETGSGSQQASKRLNRQPAASAETFGHSKKRPAGIASQHSAVDKGLKNSSKRLRVSAAILKGSAAVAGHENTGVRTSGHRRAEEMKENEESIVRLQPAKRPARTVHAQKSLTVPKSPRLGRSRDQVKQAKDAAKPQQGEKKQGKAGASKRALTEAKTPQLRTSKRKRTADTVERPMAQEHEEWKPLALMVAEFEASTPARFNHGPRAVQYVPPPQPDPDARAAAPDLATDGRLRPSRYKPHEDQEVEEIRSRPAFHALPINAAVMNSRGDLGVHPVPARPVTRGQTPKLATRARAATHPALPQMQQPVPKQRAPFDPLKLTVPQSPAFATRSRLRAQGIQPVEPAELNFMFKARPMPDQGAGQFAIRPKKNQNRRQTSSFKPFQLSTDARGRAKRSAGSEAEPAQAPAFQAAPVPKTLYRPAQLPVIHEAKPTEQQAFHLQSEARHQQAVAEQEAKQKAERARARRQSQFRAAPPPRFPQPAPTARSERPATRGVTPRLAVETRSAARCAFDATVAENKRKEEEKRAAEAAERAAEEARELKEYRSQLTFKARSMPEQSTGARRMYVLPEPNLTVPTSPQLQTHSRARRAQIRR